MDQLRRQPRRRATAAITCALVLAGVLSATSAPPADAAPLDYTITTTADGGPGSLRAAIAEANAGNVAGEAVTFFVPTGTYDLTVCGIAEDDLGVTGDLDVTTDASISIVGTGPNVVIHQTCAGERVLDQHGAGLTVLDTLTISGGAIVGPSSATPAMGGGARITADAHLSGVTVSGNSATGAPSSLVAPDGGAALGGGVYVGGALDATNATFSGNTATGANGIDAIPTSGTGGNGGRAEGGAVFTVGDATFEGGGFTTNTATAARGGSSDANPGSGGNGRGGGVAKALGSDGTVALHGTALTGNSVRGGDSGSLNQAPPLPPGTYLPAGTATGGGVAASGVLDAGSITATNNTATGGSGGMGACAGFGGTCPSPATPGTGDGGALAANGIVGASPSTVTSSTFTANQARSGDSFLFFFSQAGTPVGGAGSAARGGAVWSLRDLAVSQSTFGQNGARQGVGTPTANGAAFGGAVAGGAHVSLTGGSFTANTTTTGSGGAVGVLGTLDANGVAFEDNVSTGGAGGAVLAQNMTATDSTFHHNTGSGTGGGAISAGTDLTLTRVAVTDNVVNTKFYGSPNGLSAGGGVLVGEDLVLTDTTISGNSGSATFSQGILCRDCPVNFRGGGSSSQTVTATNVTVSGNTASGPAGGPFNGPGPSGGGIFAITSATLTNTTIEGNQSVATYTDGTVTLVGAGVWAEHLSLEHATLVNNLNASTIATTYLNSHRSAAIPGDGQPICSPGATVESSSYDIFADATCGLSGVGDQQGPALFLLGPVADNGGPVPTMMPAPSSVLVDAAPPAACPTPVDARGITRPQGTGCDVGAVEVEEATDTGPTDLAIAFSSPPPSVTPGTDGTWTITIANNGPGGARPALVVDLPAGVTVTSSSVTGGGGACGVAGATLSCVWSVTIPSGTTATVTFVGHVDSAVVDALAFHATVSAPGALPPLTDDEADLATPVTPSADVHLRMRFERTWDDPGHVHASLLVDVINDGPSNALGTAADPIEVEFQPTPGVHGTGSTLVGSFAPSASPIANVWIDITLDPGTPVPAVIGTVVLHSGAVPDPDLSGQTVTVAGTDLSVVASREGGIQTPGQATTFTMTVANWGPATVENVVVSLYVSDAGTPVYTTSAGTVHPDGGLWGPSWQIPSLAAGATAVLTGTVTGQGSYAGMSARVSSDAVDFDEENDTTDADLRAAPHGTADLRVDSIKVYMAGPGQRVLRTTVTNHGLSPVTAGPNNPITVRLMYTPEAHGTHAVTKAAGWTCRTYDAYSTECTSRFTMAAGAMVVIDFAVEGTYPDTQPRLGASVTAFLTIDPRHANNVKFVNAAFAWPWAPPPLPG
jgi:uncharacterized repeat protein (TIGR01451 family)